MLLIPVLLALLAVLDSTEAKDNDWTCTDRDLRICPPCSDPIKQNRIAGETYPFLLGTPECESPAVVADLFLSEHDRKHLYHMEEKMAKYYQRMSVAQKEMLAWLEIYHKSNDTSKHRLATLPWKTGYSGPAFDQNLNELKLAKYGTKRSDFIGNALDKGLISINTTALKQMCTPAQQDQLRLVGVWNIDQTDPDKTIDPPADRGILGPHARFGDWQERQKKKDKHGKHERKKHKGKKHKDEKKQQEGGPGG